MKPVTALVLATQLLGAVALAQEIPSASEFGRASGGEIRAVTKDIDGRFSGTLGFTTSSGFLGGRSNGYSASAGGTLVNDRAWFFASAESLTSRYGAAIPGSMPNANALDARFNAALNDRNSFDATYTNAQSAAIGSPAEITLPSSFLSLRYTGIVSSNMFVTASVTRGKSEAKTGF
ncbi:MAG TPA: hypothetical protein VHW00_17715 [Thermoanaerobaculia bacterium]|nr:hypothetical protein [Thermoanaerobaculia bacterium]